MRLEFPPGCRFLDRFDFCFLLLLSPILISVDATLVGRLFCRVVFVERTGADFSATSRKPCVCCIGRVSQSGE